MKPLTAREVERLLAAHGYVLHRVCGSHEKLLLYATFVDGRQDRASLA